MPAVRKNKQKNKWEFDYKDLTGKRKTKGGFATKVEAEKAQAKMIDELNKGLFVNFPRRIKQNKRINNTKRAKKISVKKADK